MKKLNIALVAHDARKQELIGLNLINTYYITIILLLLALQADYLVISWLNKLQKQTGKEMNIL